MASGRPRDTIVRFGLALASLGLTWASVEIGVDLFVSASSRCSGELWGLELPPCRVVPPRVDKTPLSASEPSPEDLRGVYRGDPLIGYVAKENQVSPHGWWQSNNVGARSSRDVAPGRPEGVARILVFGDSYTNGSRVRQDETWVEALDAALPSAELLNFGMDGYSLGQCLLRYRQVADLVEHDGALLVFVPGDDLWREVNVLRGLRGWHSTTLLPRFVVDRDEARLVLPPSGRVERVSRDDAFRLTPAQRDHLLRYDRFYSPHFFESPTLLGNSILYKLVALSLHERREGRLEKHLTDPGSEALTVTRAIANQMQRELEARGAWLRVVLLPGRKDTDANWDSPAFAGRWQAMTTWLCRTPLRCLDLSPTLFGRHPDDLDRGYDGSHYGAETQRRIAAALARALGPE